MLAARSSTGAWEEPLGSEAEAGKLDELPLPVPKEKTEWKR